MRKIITTACLIVSLASGTAGAGGDPAAGQIKASSCAFCHGPDGNSSDPAIPKLAGQFEKYILQQSLLFHSGKRKDAAMQGVTAVINSDQDLADIAAHFASQVLISEKAPNSVTAQQGKIIYEGMLKCYLCHGPNGEGNPGSSETDAAPRLAGQHKTYLIKTLKEFRSAQRRSKNGFMMNTIMPMVSDAEIEALCEYLSRIDLTAPENPTDPQ
ncbi:MAG: hypothetical protein A2V90_04885 [Gammaproteobacteria bacterium RBG_16_57_12]|nr:MAG: hypothetical protein A2V90_04885 [Gammaproteobacteria bacterium RBG_16_57_12]